MRRITGKIIGGILGFLFYGPPGAVIGFLIGHIHDKNMAASARRAAHEKLVESFPYPGGLSDSLQQSTFTIGVIVLGAKMAKADGHVSPAEVAAFKRVFHIPESQTEQVGRLFDQARQTAGGYEPYAARLAQVFRGNMAVLEEILTGLFLVAAADRTGLSPAKAFFLQRIAVLFGFSEQDFERIAARSGVHLPNKPAAAKKEEAYVVLGLQTNASDDEIKKTYRALIRKHHPDKLVAQGLPAELVNQATEKMKRINAAYDLICKARGIK